MTIEPDTTKPVFFWLNSNFWEGKTFAARPCCPSSLRVWVQPCLPRPQRHHPWCQPQRSSSSCLCWCHHRGQPWDHRSCHPWDPRPTCNLVEISLIESSPLPKIPRVFMSFCNFWYSLLKLGRIYNLTTIFTDGLFNHQPDDGWMLSEWWVKDDWMRMVLIEGKSWFLYDGSDFLWGLGCFCCPKLLSSIKLGTGQQTMCLFNTNEAGV